VQETSKQTSKQTPKQGPFNIFYGWWLVGLAVFTMTVIITPMFKGLGFFFVGLEQTFGWKRDKLSIPFTFARAEGALLGPVEGYMVDRLGPRKTVIFGLLLLSIGFLAFSYVQNFTQFFIAFLVITAGGGFGGFMPFIAAVNSWFRHKRAKAMAFAMLGISLGGLVSPLLGWGVEEYGWRMIAKGFGFAIAVMAIPIGRMVRDRPEDYGLLPDGDSPLFTRILQWLGKGSSSSGNQQVEQAEVSSTVKNALKTRGFWLVATCHGLSAMAPVTLSIHMVPALVDAGWSLTAAGTVLFVEAAATALFQFSVGLFGDKVRKEPAITVMISLQALGVLIFALGLANEHTLTIFAGIALYGGGFGARIPLITSIRGDYFGRNNFGTIMGVSQVPMNAIMFGAPLAAGWLYETFKSYTVPFVALAVLNLLGGLIMLWSRHPDETSIPRINSKAFWIPVPQTRNTNH